MSSLPGHRQLSHVQPIAKRTENTDPGLQRARKDKKKRETVQGITEASTEDKHSTVILTNTATREEEETAISAASSGSHTHQTTKLHSPNQHQKFLLLPDPLQMPFLQAKPQSLRKGLLSPHVKTGDCRESHVSRSFSVAKCSLVTAITGHLSSR